MPHRQAGQTGSRAQMVVVRAFLKIELVGSVRLGKRAVVSDGALGLSINVPVVHARLERLKEAKTERAGVKMPGLRDGFQ